MAELDSNCLSYGKDLMLEKDFPFLEVCNLSFFDAGLSFEGCLTS